MNDNTSDSDRLEMLIAQLHSINVKISTLVKEKELILSQINEARSLLRKKLLEERVKLDEDINTLEKPYEETVAKNEGLLSMEIDVLKLTSRTHNGLRAENIDTVRMLITYRQVELLKIPNMGRRNVNEIKSALESYGLSLAE